MGARRCFSRLCISPLSTGFYGLVQQCTTCVIFYPASVDIDAGHHSSSTVTSTTQACGQGRLSRPFVSAPSATVLKGPLANG